MRLIIVIFWLWASTRFDDVSHWLLRVGNDLDSQFVREVSFYFMRATDDGAAKLNLIVIGALMTVVILVVANNLLLMRAKNAKEESKSEFLKNRDW